uniref:Kinesin-like protein KIF15 n=1 Tax=Ascaris suum TaxID=6253 RepID=F1KRQ4_ASCSU
MKEAISVAARVRPPAERVTQGPGDTIIEVISASKIRVKNGCEYSYDRVFPPDCDQDSVFESIGRRIVDGCLGGYNGTIFAYGQTGSGKTYTMLGPPGGQDVIDEQPHLRGLIPRSVEHLFRELDEKSEKLGSAFTYQVKCTFSQLYNENFYDLLSADSRRVTPRPNKNGIMYLAGASERVVLSTAEVVQLLNQGLMNRHVAETAMNQESSRSHAIFTLELTTTLIEGGLVNVRRSILNLVDLAGSERQRDTETNSKTRVKEACSINSSLLMLGRVIRELADPNYKKDCYVPYRDSGLTYLLKDSLGGNARTAFIVTVHPNKRYAEETICALRFAQDVKKVRNVAAVNEDLSGENVDALKAEIIRLKDQLRGQAKVSEKDFTRLQEELAVSKARAQSWEDMAQAKSAELEQCRGQLRMRDFSIRIFHESSAPIDVKQSIANWQAEFDELIKDFSNNRTIRRGNLTDLDVYQLSDRVNKAENEVKILRERLRQAEEEKKRGDRRSSQLREQFRDVERRLSFLISPTASPQSHAPKSAARARRERRMTRFTLSPSRSAPRSIADPSTIQPSVANENAFQSELDVNDGDSVIKELSERLRCEQSATLRADVYANHLEQQLQERDDLLKKYQMGENEKLVAFATKVESLEVEKEQLESEISRLREEIGNLEPAYGEMRAELAAMKHHAVELANERDSLLAKERELTAEVRRKNELVHECRERIDELGARLEANAACEGDLRKMNAELEEKKASVTQKVDTLKMEREILLNETAMAHQKMLELKRELSSVREELTTKEEELQAAHEARIQNAHLLDSKASQISVLEAKLLKVNSEREDEKAHTEKVIQEANGKVEKIEREFSALVEAVMNVTSEVGWDKRRRSCFGEAIGQVNNLANTISQMKKQLGRLQNERDELIAVKDSNSKEIAKLKEGRELVERDLEELMNNSRPTCRINLFQRYREKCALLEEQNRGLREENVLLRERQVSQTKSSLSSLRGENGGQENETVPLDPTLEGKENTAPKQRRRRINKTKQ